MEYLHILIELFGGYFALFILTKILGKTQITQITTFDFVSALVLGELVGNALYDNEIGLGQIIFAVALWGILIYTMEYITQKKMGTRKLLEGQPSIIIRYGKIDYHEMKRNNLDLNQLQHLLRAKDIFSISECEFAILETDGTVSAVKKPLFANPTMQDLKLSLQPYHIPISLILDGEIVFDNLHLVNWSREQLEQELKALGAASHKEVLLAEYKEGEALYIQKY